jgi:endoglucanase
MSINDYNNQTDLYRAFMPDDQYTWGSNETKASAGLDNFDFATFGINPANAAVYKEIGESYLHWFHGVNPMGKVMLTNMYAFGADSSVNEFYHSWFGDGTPWDNVFTSLYGPPPGYLPGGPNKNFSIQSISPPGMQPPQKSFREWNTGWNGTANENSWEITEAGIYTQSAYISLLVRTMATATQTALPLYGIALSGQRNTGSVYLKWQVDDAVNSKSFEVQRSTDRIHFIAINRADAISNTTSYTLTDDAPEAQRGIIYYRVKETGLQGAVHYSPVLTINDKNDKDHILVYPNPAKDEFTLSGYAAASHLLELKMIDVSGKLLLQEKWQQTSGNYSRNISISNLPSGIYWLQIDGAEKSKRIKMVKL